MTFLRKLPHWIDRLSMASGAVGKWFAVLLVLAGTFETISRHFFNAPTIWAYDTMCMAGGAIYLLGASYTYFKDSHTRVDLIYSRFSPKGQAWIDVIGAAIFFFPLMIVMFDMSVRWAIRAWSMNEVMFTSFWYPPAGPYRTLFAIGLLLLILQAAAKFARDVYLLVKDETLD